MAVSHDVAGAARSGTRTGPTPDPAAIVAVHRSVRSTVVVASPGGAFGGPGRGSTNRRRSWGDGLATLAPGQTGQAQQADEAEQAPQAGVVAVIVIVGG